MATGQILQTYNCAKTALPNYWLHVRCAGIGVEIIADMPEEFSTSVTSEWESLMPSNLGALFGQAAENVGKAAFGTGAVAQKLSEQIWVNSSPLEIALTMLFDAKNDAYRDVVAPMRLLEMMAMPAESNGILYSPGPNRGGAAGGDLSTQITVGRQFVLTEAIITSVSCTTSSRLDEKGYPIAGRAEINVRSSVVLSRANWASITGVQLPTFTR